MTQFFGGNVERLSVSMPLFDFVLNRSAQRQLASKIEIFDVNRGQVLAREGDSGQCLYVLAEGAVKLSKTLPHNRVQIVAFRGAGDLVGLHRAYTPWPVTVETLSPCSVFKIDWDDLRILARRSPQIERILLDLAGDEIAALQEHLLTLGRKTTEEKVASFLLALYRPNGLQPLTRREIHLPMRRVEIADYLGLTTASVSRELTRLKKLKIVSLPRPSRVVLLDQAKLETLASGDAQLNHRPQQDIALFA